MLLQYVCMCVCAQMYNTSIGNLVGHFGVICHSGVCVCVCVCADVQYLSSYCSWPLLCVCVCMRVCVQMYNTPVGSLVSHCCDCQSLCVCVCVCVHVCVGGGGVVSMHACVCLCVRIQHKGLR